VSDQKQDPRDESWDDCMIQILRHKLTETEAKAHDTRQHLKLCNRRKKRAKMQRMTELQALQDELRLYNGIDIEPTTENTDTVNTDTVIRDMLRQIEELQIYKLAMESMAKQFIHPRMTALELAELQLKGKTQ